MVYYLDENTGNRNTAGSKAPTDISEICASLGYKPLIMPTIKLIKRPKIRHLEEVIKLSLFWRKVARQLNSEDVLLYQHPTLGKPIAARYLKLLIEKKKCKIITLIHDLESLRGGIVGQIKVNAERVNRFEQYILNNSSSVICHNYKMAEYLEIIGVDKNKIVKLDLFDYLHGTQRKGYIRGKASVAIAGNLSPAKCGYIYRIGKSPYNKDLLVHLYGVFYEKQESSNVIYHGSFAPEALGEVMEGDFGLVWDGPSITTCEGNTGEYLRYNNPHKASMYLSAGIPIITWKEAAISKFVQENNVGIIVDSLDDIESIINNITDQQYYCMVDNAFQISQKLLTGKYFRLAMEKALKQVL